MKVQGRDCLTEEATWETDIDMLTRYPHLISLQVMPFFLFMNEIPFSVCCNDAWGNYVFYMCFSYFASS